MRTPGHAHGPRARIPIGMDGSHSHTPAERIRGVKGGRWALIGTTLAAKHGRTAAGSFSRAPTARMRVRDSARAAQEGDLEIDALTPGGAAARAGKLR
jgi:hypothetical protein